MKNYIFSMLIVLLGICAQSQNPIVQVEQIDVDITKQDGITMTHTFAEPVVGVDMQDETTIIIGFYPLELLDPTGPSSVRDLLPIEGLNVYPNPTRTRIVLSGIEKDHGTFKIEVYNASGQFVKSESWNSGAQNFELSLDPYASGIFHVRVHDINGDRLSHFKVLKH